MMENTASSAWLLHTDLNGNIISSNQPLSPKGANITRVIQPPENNFLISILTNWKEFRGTDDDFNKTDSFELQCFNQTFIGTIDPIFAGGKIVHASLVMIKKPSSPLKPTIWNHVLSPDNKCIAEWILEQVEHAIIATSLEGTIKFWNRGAANLYGWSAEEVIGRNIVEVTPSEMTQNQGKEIMTSLSQGKVWNGEFEVRKRDNSKFVANVVDAPMKDANMNLVGIIGISFDHTPFVKQRQELLELKASLEKQVEQRTKELVQANEKLTQEITERRRAQEELELLSLVAKKTDTGILISDRTLHCQFANDAFLKLTGYEANEILNQTPVDILKLTSTKPETIENIQQALSNDNSITLDVDITSKQGEILTLATEITPVFDDQGHRTQAVIMMKNVTAKIKIEEAIKKADEEAIANKLKTQFITTLSHELRTPLNAIIGMTSLMKNGDLSNQIQIRKDLETILCCSEILLLLVNNVLDLRKIESGKVDMMNEPFQLGSTVKEVVRACEPLSAQKSVIITVDNRCNVDLVVGDVTKLKQILVNLCANAIKFTRACSEIQISVELQQSTETEYTFLFSVKDSGPGIPPEKLNLLFKKFSQLHDLSATSVQGSGLGLSISKHLVAMMKGSIWVDSNLGEGSVFRFTANFAKMTENEEKQISSNVMDVGVLKNTSLSILLVEDNPVNQKVMVRMLERIEMKCDIANNGREAVELNIKGDYDVIFMDVMMPEMNGIESTKIIVQSGKQPRIVGLTANATPEYMEHCLSVGMNEVLTKPTSLEKIQQALLNALLFKAEHML